MPGSSKSLAAVSSSPLGAASLHISRPASPVGERSAVPYQEVIGGLPQLVPDQPSLRLRTPEPGRTSQELSRSPASGASARPAGDEEPVDAEQPRLQPPPSGAVPQAFQGFVGIPDDPTPSQRRPREPTASFAAPEPYSLELPSSISPPSSSTPSSGASSYRSMASNLEVAARGAPSSVITVKKDGLAQVHPSTSQTVLYPTMNEEGLQLISARKHCMSELVRVGSNPAYTLSLLSLADTLDSMLLDHAFSCSEAGRFFKEHQSTLRAELLEHQRDVDTNRRSLASVWDAVMWQPLVDAYGQPTVDDQRAIVQLVLFEDLNGKVVERGHSVIAWLHHIYVERSELLVPEILAQVMAKAVKMATKYCSSSERYGKRVPRYMAEFTTFLHSLQQHRMSQADAARFFKHLRQRARDEDAGNRLLADASSDSSTSSSGRRYKGKAKGKARGKHRARVLLTAHGSSSEEEDVSGNLRAGAYAAIAGLRSQPSGSHLPQPPPLTALDPKVHALMLKFAHVPVVWLEAILGGLPMDLPQHIPHGLTVKTCYYGPNPPCASCSSKCAGCGWNSQHSSSDCQWIKPYVDRLLNQQRNQGGGQGRGGNGGGRGGGRQGGQGGRGNGGNGGNGGNHNGGNHTSGHSGGGRHGANPGGQAYPIQLAPSVMDPGPSASVAGGGEPYTFTAAQVSALMQQAARATSPTPRNSSGSVISQPLTNPLFATPLPAAARALQQADLRQCFVVQHAPVGLHALQHDAEAFVAHTGPRGFTQASAPAADYAPPRAGPAGHALPPGVTPPAAHLPTLRPPGPSLGPATTAAGLHSSAASPGLALAPGPPVVAAGLHSSAASPEPRAIWSLTALQDAHVRLGLEYAHFSQVLVPAMRGVTGLQVTVEGRNQDVMALLQLLDSPTSPSVDPTAGESGHMSRLVLPLGSMAGWFAQAVPRGVDAVVVTLAGPGPALAAALAASQPSPAPGRAAATLAVRAATPTSPAWASDRNGSLPVLTQPPGQAAFHLRFGPGAATVVVPDTVRPDTCATGTFMSDSYALRIGVETVETRIVATGVGGSQAVRTTKDPVAHVLNPGTDQERVVWMRPLIVNNVKEEQFQVLLGIDFMHAAGVTLDMAACRLWYDVEPAGPRGLCGFTMTVPSSLLLTAAGGVPPSPGPCSSTVSVLYPLAPLDPPQQVSLYVLNQRQRAAHDPQEPQVPPGNEEPADRAGRAAAQLPRWPPGPRPRARSADSSASVTGPARPRGAPTAACADSTASLPWGLPPHLLPAAPAAPATDLPPHLSPASPAPVAPVDPGRPPRAAGRPFPVPRPPAEPAPAEPAAGWEGGVMAEAPYRVSWAVPVRVEPQQLAVNLTDMWRHHAARQEWPEASQVMRHLVSMHEGLLQTDDGWTCRPYYLEPYTTPSAWNKTKARVKLMREWTSGELHARRWDNAIPRSLTNALPTSAHPTQRADKLTDDEMLDWFAAFGVQLGLPDGCQPNPDPLALPPPPTYGCKPPGPPPADDEPDSGGAGPGCNPAAALLRRYLPPNGLRRSARSHRRTSARLRASAPAWCMVQMTWLCVFATRACLASLVRPVSV